MRRVPRPTEQLRGWADQITAWLEDYTKREAEVVRLRRGAVTEPGQEGQLQQDGSRPIFHNGTVWAPIGARVSTYANRNASPVAGELAIFTDGIGGGGSSALAAYDGSNWV